MYRFVVDGHARQGGHPEPYRIVSEAFEVVPWQGLGVADISVAAGSVTLRVVGAESDMDDAALPGPVSLSPRALRYPVSYNGPAYLERAVEKVGARRYCYQRSFRPWARVGEVESLRLEVHDDEGGVTAHTADFDGEQWLAEGLALDGAESVAVPAGAIRDEFGNINGQAAVQTLP